MIIPTGKYDTKMRDERILEIRDQCLESRNDRAANYVQRRRYFMFGTNATEQVRYNRLFAHIDLVCSFLYSPDHATYNLAPPLNASDSIVAQATALGDYWNQCFRDSGVAYTYALGLLWALIYDTCILKMGWNDARKKLYSKLVMPTQFGVYDETESDFEAQEAFVHTYRLYYDEACLRLIRAGMKSRIKDLGVEHGTDLDDMPPVLKNLILTSIGSANLSANIMGQAPMDILPAIRYEAKQNVETIEFQELWVWDSLNDDYIIFSIAKPDIVLADSRDTIIALKTAGKMKQDFASKTNLFLPQMTPFVPITPFMLPDYFWGEAHCDRLSPLQDWTNERLNQIADILEQQADPAKVFSGFMGLQDEKAGAFGGPGTHVIDAIPGAKVEPLRPTMPEDIFREYEAIGGIMMEASGITATVAGKGEQGVRGGGHARQLQTTGGARIRKTAVLLEPSLVEIGDLGVHLTMENDDEHLTTEDGQEFVAKQFAEEEWSMRIAGHSHSPLFVDEGRELAQTLIKYRAIDREMFIRLLRPPERDTMIHRLRRQIKAERDAAQQQALLNPGGQKPNGKARQTGGHHGSQASSRT